MKQDEIIEMARQHGIPVELAAHPAVKKLVHEVSKQVEARYMQLFLDPENQPTQFGTATEQYREQEINDETEMCAEVLATSADAYDGEGKPAAAALLRMHAHLIRARGE